MLHDGLVIRGRELLEVAGLEIRGTPWRSIETSGEWRTGAAVCATMQSSVSISSRARSPFGLSRPASFAYGMRVDVSTLARERARHRVEAGDAEIFRTLLRDQLLRDLFALDEIPEP